MNELLLGSGQYLFWFKIAKTAFDFSMQCLKYMRLRAPLRSITWNWNTQNKKGTKVAEIVIGDSEEGVSLFIYEDQTNTLKLKGFDIGIKQVLYSDLVQIPNVKVSWEE